MKRFKYLTMAALVAFAACEEGTDPVVTPPVQGTISGAVTIEGAAASDVTVTLSTGATATTDAAGTFTFSAVPAGAYTVTISGFASDATFASTSKAATIATAGQVSTANFDGAYVRTSAILGSVAAGGTGLANVSISLSGPSAGSVVSDGNGQYSFSGLRAGSYTVSMSNPDAGTYNFASMSSTVTVGAGQSEVVNFSGSLLATATIEGWIYIDENDKDDMRSPGLEEDLTVANVQIVIEGIAVAMFDTLQTDANGHFMIGDLEAGTYRLTINAADTDIPPMVTYGMASTAQLVTVTTGSTGTVNFPFDITTQTIIASGFLGIDGTKPGVTPIKDWTINLYDTQANAAGGTATGRIGTGKTDADGNVAFRFLRTGDNSPQTAAIDDLIVFAQVGAGTPTATHVQNGETIIEISFNPKDSLTIAPDTFDALYNALTVGIGAKEIDDDAAAGWQAVLRDHGDTINGAQVDASGATATNGWRFFNIAQGFGSANATFPDTVWMRLSTTQAAANGHGFKQVPEAMQGTVHGGMLRYIWDGTTSPGDTIKLGYSVIEYTDVDVLVGVHAEKDDTVNYTVGDQPATTPAAGAVQTGSLVQLYETTTGSAVSLGAAIAPGSAGAPWATNERPYFNIPTTGKTYQIRARTLDVNLDILNDTMIDFTLDSGDQIDTISTLMGTGGVSTFAMKANNTTITGLVQSQDGVTPVAGLRVMVKSTPMNIQAHPTGSGVDTTVVTTAGGAYTVAGLREGPYTVMVEDSVGANAVWSFFNKLTTTTAPLVSGTEKGGNPVNNDDAFMGTRDSEGYGSTSVVNLEAHRMDTKIQGVVVNDRDMDFNTLDPNEALSGVTLNLIDDADADGVVDSGEATLATTITDITGAYSFENLKEDNYIVTAESPSNATVLRALSATGAVTNTTGALVTTAATGAGATLNQSGTKQVGNTSPPVQGDEFPRWNYMGGTAALDSGLEPSNGPGPNSMNAALTTAPTHFVHLFNTGTIQGAVKAAGVGVSGATVTITRCQTAAIAPSPPAIGACTLKHGVPSPHIVNVDSDGSGNYSASGLLEGVYQVDVAPQTAGYTNIVVPGAPGSYLATLVENNDIETVPDFTIS